MNILAFTDPVCTWCWGSEPVLRALEWRHGADLSIDYVMGGLVKDIREFFDPYHGIGGDPERSNAAIARHWVEASERHGMPVRSVGFRLFSADTVSTYPQNIAYKAARIAESHDAMRDTVAMRDTRKSDAFLRRMREATAAEARETGRREVLVELASECGVDLARFLAALDDGSAEAAFRADLELTRRYGVRGFPTFLFRHDGRETLVRGYQSLESMEAVIASLSGGAIRPAARAAPAGSRDGAAALPAAGILEFLARFGRSAPAELALALGRPRADIDRDLERLESSGDIRRTAAGNGHFIESAHNAMCDPVTGLCGIGSGFPL